MIKIKQKQVNAFVHGLKSGVVDFAIGEKLSFSTYKTQYNTKAFEAGVETANTKQLYDVWKAFNIDMWIPEKLLKYCIDNNLVRLTDCVLVQTRDCFFIEEIEKD